MNTTDYKSIIYSPPVGQGSISSSDHVLMIVRAKSLIQEGCDTYPGTAIVGVEVEVPAL